MTDDVTVAAWRDEGTFWRQVGQVGVFNPLHFAPAFLDHGDWSMTVPLTDDPDDDILDLLDPAHMVTIDFRGVRTTWRIGAPRPYRAPDTGEQLIEVAGVGALSMLGWCVALPNPDDATADLSNQPVLADTDPAPYKGPAETVIKQLVADNFAGWYGRTITIPPTQGRGSVQPVRPVMDNLLELVTNLAKLGGIGVDVGLVSPTPTSTRADLTLLVWTPQDKTKSVTLTTEAGTLATWDQPKTEPTLTKAIVAGGGTGGMDRVRLVVTTPESEAAAAEWGGHRVQMIDGPDSFDPDELRQAGEQAILDGASTRTLALTAAESEGLQGFRDYKPGDIGTGQVLPGAKGLVREVITSIGVTIDTDNGIVVEPVFGDPAAADEDLDIADQIRKLKRRIRHQERRK